ncbi:unnamed protein product [Cunninghamella blakesleeana]
MKQKKMMKSIYIFVCLALFILNMVLAAPVYNVKISPTTLKAGDNIHITWDYNDKVKDSTFSVYPGHNTEKKHIPPTLLEKNVWVSRKKVSVTLPKDISPSHSMNQWLIELFDKSNTEFYDQVLRVEQ